MGEHCVIVAYMEEPLPYVNVCNTSPPMYCHYIVYVQLGKLTPFSSSTLGVSPEPDISSS